MWKGILDIEEFAWKGSPSLGIAGEENKILDSALKEKKAKVQELKAALELENERGKRMHTHHGDLTLEKNLLHQQLNAHRHEVEVEDNNQKLLSRERSRLNQGMEDMKNEIETLKGRHKIRKSTITEQAEKREAFKSAIHWEEEALLKWLRESAEMERDRVALIKYTHQDESKIKDLTHSLERLAKDSKFKKQELDEVNTELYIAQSELDKIQEEFRNAHKERQDIISNWEKVLQGLQNKNDEIDQLAKYMEDMRKEEVNLQQNLLEQKQLLATEVVNNKEMQRKVTEQENNSAKLRMRRNTEMKRESDLRAELETLRNISVHLSHTVQHTRNNIKHLNELIKQRQDRIVEAVRAQKKLQSELDALAKATFDTEHYAQELDKLLHLERNKLSKVQGEYNAIQNSVLKYTQELKETLVTEKAKESELKGMKVSSRNLSNVITKLEHDRVEQQKLLASINIIIKQTEHRVSVMEGELANDDERWQMQNERDRLQKILDEKKTALEFLNQQVKTMMEKITLSVKTLYSSKKQDSELRERIDFLEYFIANSQKGLKQERDRKEAFLVDECMAKLQLGRYQELLRQRNSTVLDLQRNRVEFEALMKERILEVKMCKDMLQNEVRKEEEEVYQTKRDLQQCADKVAKFQTRYEVLLNALGLSEVGENAQVDLLLKAEDEKHTLHLQRDGLIKKVIEKEEELQAFRNTLWMVQANNEQFRQMLNPAGLTSEENDLLKKLEDEKRKLDIEIHNAIQRQQDLDQEISGTETSLQEIRNKISRLDTLLSDKKHRADILNKEMEQLSTKLTRADKSNSRIEIETLSSTNKSAIETDIHLHLLRDMWKTASEQLFATVSENPELFDRLKGLFNESALPLPPNARSTLFLKGKRSSLSLAQSGGKPITSASSKSSLTSTRSQDSKSSIKSVFTPSVVSVGTDISDEGSSGVSSALSSAVSSTRSSQVKSSQSKKSFHK